MILPLLAVVAGLALFSFGMIIAGSRKIDDPALFAMLRAKYYTTLVVIAAIVLPVVAGKTVFFLWVTVFALWSQNEVMRVCQPDVTWPWRIPAWTGTLVMLAAAFAWGAAGILAGLILVAAVFLTVHCALPEHPVVWRLYGQTLAALVYPGAFWGFYLITWNLPEGPALILFFYLVTETNNAFAQLVGSMMGKTKVFAAISPNKTLEGLLGGAVGAIGAGVILNTAAFHFDLTRVLAAAGLIIFGATAGDLIASGIKRRFKVKDFGRVLPHHGGIVDMLDSVIFTAPFFYWFAVRYLGASG